VPNGKLIATVISTDVDRELSWNNAHEGNQLAAAHSMAATGENKNSIDV
jgi:hypothetical protein